MESGISNGWEVIREDGNIDQDRSRYTRQYARNPQPFKERSKKWDQAHPERKREIKREYERRSKRGSRYSRYSEYYKRYKAEQLKKKKRMDKRKKIMCIFGGSGVGKTMASSYLADRLGANVICSYTTRPKRKDEVDGVSHYFVDTVPPKGEMLAYTVFGDYEYWALKSDVKGDLTVYVIDEAGINMLAESGEYKLYPVHIIRDRLLRRKSGVARDRIKRDDDRVSLKVRTYRAIRNNANKGLLFQELRKVYNEILED